MKLLSLIAVVAGVAAAQTAPARKDISTIAKAADGAIVTIITAVDDKPIAQGTGFLVSVDGVIVTNYHVIETGNIAVVTFPNGTILPVDGVLAADKVRDLAIIKIHGKTVRTLTLGNSDKIQVGEEVVAIGNPLSLESTVSNGIISGIRTSKEQGGKFLQTTAPISPGSSGGPLFNMVGEVVGINTLYLEGGENLNFAIPINDVKRLLLNQSAKLQNLPNETEPVKSPTPNVDTQAQATLSEQRACSEQAAKRFSDYKTNPLVSLAESTNHFDPSSGICYVEILNYMVSEGKTISYNGFVENAFGSQNYGLFASGYSQKGFPDDSIKPLICQIQPLGRPEINCKSLKEFDDLTSKYFGTVSK
jgi:hypothetical protein